MNPFSFLDVFFVTELSQKQLVRSDGLALLVQILLQNQDDNEMRKTISSVLESCLRWGESILHCNLKLRLNN